MKKVVVIIFFVLLGFAGWLFFRSHSSALSSPSVPVPTNILGVSNSSTASPTPMISVFGIPSRIQIPKLGVDTRIEEVGTDGDGNMGVPEDVNNAAWYKLGHKIGSAGSAVIAAHFDKQDGSPAVFYRLASLQPGDVIKVSDTNGKTLTYTVLNSVTYPYNAFPLNEVFNSTDMPRLNLITCDGVWEHSKRTYSQRLVVYSRLIE